MAVRANGGGRPKITHVVRQFWPQKGGLEETVRQLCRHLRDGCDADVEVLTLNSSFSDGAVHPRTDSIDGIPVRRIPWFGSTRYPLAPDFLAATANADLLHVHAIDFFFDGLAAARPFRSIPMVASTHGGFFHTEFAARLKSIYFATVTRTSCRAYDVIGASSVSDAERFAAIAGDRVQVIENGVDIAKWADAGSRSFAPVMIAIGRWSSNKQLASVFALLAELRRIDPAWRVIVAGMPHDVSRAQIDAWVQAAGVAEAVEIHQGPDTDELRRLIGRASFLVSLSSYEGFGLSVVEGLSAGLVPVLSDIANYRIFVERAGIGAIVPGESAAAAQVVAGLAATVRGEADQQRAKAIAAATRYAWPAVAARWNDVYTAALARRSGDRRRAAA
ncbi:glycosyltransferase family 4 protein [Sandarakinorhabdus sp.]|uniref:glycosyltransferase family 4 protein n=1 Tax=Sandarakinorhabdus sp. TaxID=1916663 RepID=UPI00286E21D5|nr:glycosyltransferase family 4 protein [Sandarakinorhabdus sp.]